MNRIVAEYVAETPGFSARFDVSVVASIRQELSTMSGAIMTDFGRGEAYLAPFAFALLLFNTGTPGLVFVPALATSACLSFYFMARACAGRRLAAQRTRDQVLRR